MTKRLSDQDEMRNSSCTLCPKLCGNANTVCVPGYGPLDADIMLIGEAPGENEDFGGEPFIGRAGKFLDRRLFMAAGIDREEVRIENAVRCRPPGNHTPTIKEIGNCRQYLTAAVKRVRPKVALLVGNVPLASSLYFDLKKADKKGAKVSGIMRWRGKKIWHREWNCWVIPTLHPEFLSHKWNEGTTFLYNQCVEDFELANKLAHQPRPHFEEPTIVVVRDEVEARMMLDEIEASEAYAFDIETGGDGTYDERPILGFSLSASSERGFYTDWSMFKHGHLRRRLERLLTSDRTLIMHNGDYEQQVLRHAGVKIKRKYFDTMVAAKMLDENFGVGLKDLSWVHTEIGGYDVPLERYKAEIKMKSGDPDYSKIPFEVLSVYGGFDAVAEYTLYERFVPMLEEEQLYPLFSKISMPVRAAMSDATFNGFKVDLDRARDLQRRGKETIRILEERIFSEVGREFNINSTPQLRKILFKDLGFEPLKVSKKTEEPSSDKESLEHCLTQDPGNVVIRSLLDRSYTKTMIGTHVRQALEYVWKDGRVHTHYNLTGTVTGRASASEPGIHNVPRDRLIRSLYIAGPGRKIVEADLKTAELAYLAAESGEETFIRAFKEGLDLHSETYKTAFDKPESYQVSKEERQIAKCFHPDTEVLTPTGWVRMRDLNGQPIMQAVLKKGAKVDLEWTDRYRCPLATNHHDKLVHLKSEGIDLLVTPDHRMVVQKSVPRAEWDVVTPYEVPKAGYFPNAGILRGGITLDESLVRFAVAAQVAGSYCGNRIRFEFREKLKVGRLERLLSLMGADFRVQCRENQPYPVWEVSVWGEAVDRIKGQLDGEMLSWWVLGLNYSSREAIVDEVGFWGSHDRDEWNHYQYTSSSLQNAEVLQALATSVGLKTRMVKQGPTSWELSIEGTDRSRGENVSAADIPYTGEVALLSVPSTFVLVRHGGVPAITGQTINFGLVYGMTAYGLSLRLGIPIEQAEDYIDQYFARLPKVQAYMGRLREMASEKGYVSSLFKRRRRVPNAQSDLEWEANRALRQAMNAPIQSGAADYTYAGLIRLSRALSRSELDAMIVHTVHDCVVTDSAEGSALEVAGMIKTAFETPISIIPVQMRVDVGVHDAWGEDSEESRLESIFESVGLEST